MGLMPQFSLSIYTEYDDKSQYHKGFCSIKS